MELFAAKSGGLINVLRGLIPAVDTFGVDPTYLERITDEDFSTPTGAGTKDNSGGAGTVGQLTFTLPASMTLIIGGKIDLSASTGSMNLIIDVSEDGNSWITGPGYAYSITKTGAGAYFIGYPYLTRGKYIRFRFTSGGAANPGSVTIYQLVAYKLGN